MCPLLRSGKRMSTVMHVVSILESPTHAPCFAAIGAHKAAKTLIVLLARSGTKVCCGGIAGVCFTVAATRKSTMACVDSHCACRVAVDKAGKGSLHNGTQKRRVPSMATIPTLQRCIEILRKCNFHQLQYSKMYVLCQFYPDCTFRLFAWFSI